MPTVDMRKVRQAVHSRDASLFLETMTGNDIDDALQQLAPGISLLLESRSDEAANTVMSFIGRLAKRDGPGDHQLAADLRARLRNDPLPGDPVAVDLEMLIDLIEGDPSVVEGGYVDVSTGSVFPPDVTDPIAMGDSAIDVDADPERYVWFECLGSNDGWRDMADFAQRQEDSQRRAQLERAIDGRGAFRAFSNVVFDTELEGQWITFSTDRRFGRGRDRLALEGIRVV